MIPFNEGGVSPDHPRGAAFVERAAISQHASQHSE